MRSTIAWILIVVGLMLGLGGGGMIVIGLILQVTNLSIAGAVWAVVGALLAIGGFRVRIVPSKSEPR